MTRNESEVSIALLRRILRLDVDTGRLFWLRRDVDLFKTGKQTDEHNCAIWNGKHADTEAFITQNGSGYLFGFIGNKMFRAHRVVFAMHYGRWPEYEVDHINHIRSDNRPINLRDVTRQENTRNQSIRRANKTGVTGVGFSKLHNKYEAYIGVDGKKKHIGLFLSKEDALSARKDKELEHEFHENHGSKSI